MALNTTGYPETLVDANYPYNKAKDASGATAKDGTPWRADLMNDLWGMWQALLVRSGITPSGVSDTANASDYADAIIRSMTDYFGVSATGNYTPSALNLVDNVVVDTSGGNVTLTVASLPFEGKVINVQCSGSGLVYLKDSLNSLYQGASSLGIPISDGLKCTIRAIDGIWVADNEVTADYIDGTNRIFQSSIGRFSMYISDSITFSGVAGGGDTVPLPITLANSNYFSGAEATGLVNGQAITTYSVLTETTQVTFSFFTITASSVTGSTAYIANISGGTY